MKKVAYYSPLPPPNNTLHEDIHQFKDHDVVVVESNIPYTVDAFLNAKYENNWPVEVVPLRMTHDIMDTISRAAGRDCRNDDTAIAEYVVANYEQLVC